jgi:hypothetical protein
LSDKYFLLKLVCGADSVGLFQLPAFVRFSDVFWVCTSANDHLGRFKLFASMALSSEQDRVLVPVKLSDWLRNEIPTESGSHV